VDAAEARAVLGVAGDAPAAELRAAYRRALRRHHPDVGGTARETEAAVEAYRVLRDAPPELHHIPESPAPTEAEAWVVVDGDTVAAELPAGDLFALLVEAGGALGQISYADPQAGLLEIVVELPGSGACSVVLNLQGRGNGLTEAWCTVEPLGGGPPPSTGEIAELLASGLRRVTP
jgi:hypothetical protein